MHDLASRFLWTIIDNNEFVGERVEARLLEATIDAPTKRRQPTESRYYNTQFQGGGNLSVSKRMDGTAKSAYRRHLVFRRAEVNIAIHIHFCARPIGSFQAALTYVSRMPSQAIA